MRALSLYAALEVKSGRVTGKTAARHTSCDFIGFLREIISSWPSGLEIHIILDNLSAHKAHAVREFLEQNPRVRFHFTPTYSSWLNQVQIWFAKIECDVIARGISPRSPTSLASFVDTSTPIQPTHGLSNGNTPTLPAASLLTNSLRQATS
jgi:transposase